MRLKTLAITLLGIATLSATTAREYKLSSPNKNLTLTLNDNGGAMHYSLTQGKTAIVDCSEVSIFKGEKVAISNAKKSSKKESWKPVWGQFSEIEDNHNALELTIKVKNRVAKLEVRLFDSGAGFRYILEDYKASEDAALFFEFNTLAGDEFYWTAGEREPIGPITRESILEEKYTIRMPLVVEAASGLHLSLLESDILSTNGFTVINYQYDDKTGGVYTNNKVSADDDLDKDLVTPWRVILVNDTAGGLVTNTTSLNLASECAIEDTSWIKPGKTLWDWRVHSHVAPDGFRYGIDTESYKRFIDFAKESGMDYFLIDDAWYDKVEPGKFILSAKLDLAEVIRYAKEKDVNLLLYYDRHRGEYGDEALFPYYSNDLGMKGIKYGFMGSKVAFTRDAIRMSGDSKLLIDFHDGPLAATGAERTYPNAVGREMCHAQLDSRRTFTPEGFIKMALINAVHGPLDMNNGYFDINRINNGAREKGPRELHSYITTVVSEVARTLIINTGLLCLPDAPDVYQKKMDLFEFMLRLPIGQWDETRVINSKMGEYITTARRCGSEWYIGTVLSQNGSEDELTVTLDFLDPSKKYVATFYLDGKDADSRTNPESYRIEERAVTAGEVIDLEMVDGGGHAMWIREK